MVRLGGAMGRWCSWGWGVELNHGQGLHVEDEEVEGHGEADGPQQPHVVPGRHAQQGLVLRQTGAQRGRREETFAITIGPDNPTTFTLFHWN